MTMVSHKLLIRTTPAMGLIVLRVDETIEHEFRAFVPAETARLHISRIPSGDDLTPDSIGQMEGRLTDATALLPEAADFQVVGYACTSGTALLGSDTVERLVKSGVRTKAVTNPLDAAVAQMKHLNVNRIAIVSPYLSKVADALTDAFETRDVSVSASLTLDEQNEATVARIHPDVTADAARRLVDQSLPDAVFLSCTNLNTAEILHDLSSELGLPVLSSNHALAWHMSRLCNLN